MSEEATPKAQSNEDDVNTTPPNPPVKDGKAAWTMPEPVFKKTSGYLPQGYEKLFPKAAVDDSNSTAEMPAVDVEPQPEIADHGDAATVSANGVVAASPKKSSGLKMVLMVLGILFAIALVVVFIAVIYFLFLMPVPSGPFE